MRLLFHIIQIGSVVVHFMYCSFVFNKLLAALLTSIYIAAQNSVNVSVGKNLIAPKPAQTEKNNQPTKIHKIRI